MRWAITAIFVGVASLVAAESPAEDSAPAAAPLFERDILPVLTAHCFKCHGSEGIQAGLDLRTPEMILAGGDSGPAAVKGDSTESLLFHHLSEKLMPPEGEKPLNPAHVEAFARWIDAGLPAEQTYDSVAKAEDVSVSDEDRDFWSFRPLSPRAVPIVRDVSRVATPIDAFLLARLESVGLSFAPEAPRETLLRRAYFDLIGLPPTPEQAAEFLADGQPGAFERLVDLLLASPQFGERWGRHWLDVAGYVDTAGADNDAGLIFPAAGKWRYRDYVIGAFNADKSYDRFLVEQLAGDELTDWRSAERYTPETLELLVATGYLRNVADRTSEDELNTADIRWSVLYDTVELVGNGLLGVTTQCARCHSHKYEPVPQRDYYQLVSLFTPAYNPQQWLQPYFRDGTPKKEKYRELPDITLTEAASIDAHNAQVAEQVNAIRELLRVRLFQDKLEALPEPIRADIKVALETPAEARDAVQKYLAEKFAAALEVPPAEVDGALSSTEGKWSEEFSVRIRDLEASRRSYGKLQAIYDTGPPPATRVFRRGDYQSPGARVEPAFLSVLDDPTGRHIVPQVAADSPTSGRRLAFARWLTDAEKPSGSLASRVFVNRVWAHLFGQGIVRTQGNFGRSGSPPTHPELLDWLASDFVEHGWRTKRLIRQLMLSNAYRQASWRDSDGGTQAGVDPLAVDPGNDLLWMMRLKRLESEVVRDSLLATGGKLDATPGGPAVPIESLQDGMVLVAACDLPTPTSQNRRSVYLLARRTYNLTLLDVFDQPVINTNCTERTQSAAVLQSLAMLNDAFVLEQAEAFAQRVAATAGDSTEGRIQAAFQLAFARRPSEDEAAWSADLVSRQAARHRDAEALAESDAANRALADLCHTLFNSSEFLYVE